MDEVQNPFTPHAGKQPPYLVGREDALQDFRVFLGQLAAGRNPQSLLVTGLRGVGKTVLLNNFAALASTQKVLIIEVEVDRAGTFRTRLIRLVRQGLLSISPKANWTDRMRRVASVLRSFEFGANLDGSLTVNLGVDAAEGYADSGQLIDDLTDLFEALGQAAIEQQTCWLLLIDEVHVLAREELEALLSALHRCVQRGFPVAMIAAGLPSAIQAASSGRTYSERLLRLFTVRNLTESETAAVLRSGLSTAGISIPPSLSTIVHAHADGYPFFVQVYGYHIWNKLPSGLTVVDANSLNAGVAAARSELDSSFYSQRLERVQQADARKILRIMAHVLEGRRLTDISKKDLRLASAGEVSSSRFRSMTDKLTSDGLLFEGRRGRLAFTVPGFGPYMIRTTYTDDTLGGEEEE